MAKFLSLVCVLSLVLLLCASDVRAHLKAPPGSGHLAGAVDKMDHPSTDANDSWAYNSSILARFKRAKGSPKNGKGSTQIYYSPPPNVTSGDVNWFIIIGSTVGGALLLGLVLILYCCYCKKGGPGGRKSSKSGNRSSKQRGGSRKTKKKGTH